MEGISQASPIPTNSEAEIIVEGVPFLNEQYEVLENFLKTIIQIATEYTEHARRKVITALDVVSTASSNSTPEKDSFWYQLLLQAKFDEQTALQLAAIFEENKLEESDLQEIDHVLLQSMKISIAKTRLKILKTIQKYLEQRPKLPAPPLPLRLPSIATSTSTSTQASGATQSTMKQTACNSTGGKAPRKHIASRARNCADRMKKYHRLMTAKVLVQKEPFQILVRDIVQNYKIQSLAMCALYEAAVAHLVGHFEDMA